MNRKRRLTLTLGGLAVLAAPIGLLRANIAFADAPNEQTPEARSVTGTIASVSKNSFALTLGEAISRQAQSDPKSMTFLIDKNTTVDGKLREGAQANVTYRQDNGNNVAINVRLTGAQN
jgi:Cu/Ag efflux protein CusF